jgi:3D (Asp-Asp-Asp) domain-containing protein
MLSREQWPRAAQTAVCLALLGAFVVAVHAPADRTDWSLDDYDYIAGNPSIRSISEALSAFSQPSPPQLPEKALYRPLTNLTYAIDYSFWRDDARGYHETNVALYVVVVWLVFALAIGYDRSLPFALAVALGFAAHPSRSEVLWTASGGRRYAQRSSRCMASLRSSTSRRACTRFPYSRRGRHDEPDRRHRRGVLPRSARFGREAMAPTFLGWLLLGFTLRIFLTRLRQAMRAPLQSEPDRVELCALAIFFVFLLPVSQVLPVGVKFAEAAVRTVARLRAVRRQRGPRGAAAQRARRDELSSRAQSSRHWPARAGSSAIARGPARARQPRDGLHQARALCGGPRRDRARPAERAPDHRTRRRDRRDRACPRTSGAPDRAMRPSRAPAQLPAPRSRSVRVPPPLEPPMIDRSPLVFAVVIAAASLTLACSGVAPALSRGASRERVPGHIPEPARAVPAPEAEVEPTPEATQVRVTATAYNSLPSQGVGRGTHGAWGDRLQPGTRMIAVSHDLVALGLVRGMKVEIEGLDGHYIVMDRLPKRWSRRIDIYMGKDVRAAREWGKRQVQIRWTAPVPANAAD